MRQTTTTLTVEERRARDREYQRRARARKREQAEEAAAAAKAALKAAPGRMATALESSLEAAKWIMPSDAASVELARVVAAMIDELDIVATTDARRQQIRAQALMLRLLSELGATPVRRMALELRSRSGQVPEEPSAPNVSKFERPARNRQRGTY